MKKCLLIFTCALMALAVSCNRDPKPENERNISFTAASGEYLGDIYGKGTGNYIVTLRKGTFDEAGKPSGEAYELILDCFSDLAEDAAKITLKGGTYSLGNTGTAASGTYAPGSSNGSGTVLIEYAAGGTKKVYPLQSGTFDVSVTGDSYTVSAQLTDADNILTKGSYSGKIEFTGEIPSPVLVFENALGEYYGDCYGNNSGNWIIGLYNGIMTEDEIDPPFNLISIEVFSALPDDPFGFVPEPGIYTFDADAFENGTPFTFGGKFDQEFDEMGTFYWDMDENYNEQIILMTGGTLEVSLSGETYTITANLSGYDLQTETQFTDLVYTYSGPIRTDHYPSVRINADHALGEYYGDIGWADNMDLTLYAGGNGSNIVNGYKLFFESFAPNAEDPENPVVIEGEYTAAESYMPDEFEFAPGFDDGTGNIRSSQLVRYVDGVQTKIAVVEGYYEVVDFSDTYLISIGVFTDNDIYIFGQYSGAIEVEDFSWMMAPPQGVSKSIIKGAEPREKNIQRKSSAPGKIKRGHLREIKKHIMK